MPQTVAILKADAARAIQPWPLRLAQQWEEELVLMPSPFETSATFAYTYNTADYVATGNYIDALTGNGPLLVSKLTGAIEVAGTALSTEHYVREFEAMGKVRLGAESADDRHRLEADSHHLA